MDQIQQPLSPLTTSTPPTPETPSAAEPFVLSNVSANTNPQTPDLLVNPNEQQTSATSSSGSKKMLIFWIGLFFIVIIGSILLVRSITKTNIYKGEISSGTISFQRGAALQRAVTTEPEPAAPSQTADTSITTPAETLTVQGATPVVTDQTNAGGSAPVLQRSGLLDAISSPSSIPAPPPSQEVLESNTLAPNTGYTPPASPSELPVDKIRPDFPAIPILPEPSDSPTDTPTGGGLSSPPTFNGRITPPDAQLAPADTPPAVTPPVAVNPTPIKVNLPNLQVQNAPTPPVVTPPPGEKVPTLDRVDLPNLQVQTGVTPPTKIPSGEIISIFDKVNVPNIGQQEKAPDIVVLEKPADTPPENNFRRLVTNTVEDNPVVGTDANAMTAGGGPDAPDDAPIAPAAPAPDNSGGGGGSSSGGGGGGGVQSITTSNAADTVVLSPENAGGISTPAQPEVQQRTAEVAQVQAPVTPTQPVSPARRMHGAFIQGNTGPEVMLYPALIGAANGLYYLARRRKRNARRIFNFVISNFQVK